MNHSRRTDHPPETDVDIEVSIETRSDYLLANVRGEFRIAPIRQALIDIAAASKTTDKTHILINAMDVAEPSSEFQRFQVGQDFAELFRPPLRVAIAYPPQWINYTSENTAVNRGACLRVLGSEQAALEWLLETGAPSFPVEHQETAEITGI